MPPWAEITAPESRVGLIWAGTIAYYAQRPVVDLLGKSDRSLARLQVSPEPGLRRFWRFHPGHMKWDMAYTLTRQRPDFLPLLFPEMVRAAGPALHRDYESAELDGLRVWWRKGSPHVRSALLQRLQTLPAAASSVPSQTP